MHAQQILSGLREARLCVKDAGNVLAAKKISQEHCTAAGNTFHIINYDSHLIGDQINLKRLLIRFRHFWMKETFLSTKMTNTWYILIIWEKGRFNVMYILF